MEKLTELSWKRGSGFREAVCLAVNTYWVPAPKPSTQSSGEDNFCSLVNFFSCQVIVEGVSWYYFLYELERQNYTVHENREYISNLVNK